MFSAATAPSEVAKSVNEPGALTFQLPPGGVIEYCPFAGFTIHTRDR